MAEFSDKIPQLPDEAFTRESFYQDMTDGLVPKYLVDTNVLLRMFRPDDAT